MRRGATSPTGGSLRVSTPDHHSKARWPSETDRPAPGLGFLADKQIPRDGLARGWLSTHGVPACGPGLRLPLSGLGPLFLRASGSLSTLSGARPVCLSLDHLLSEEDTGRALGLSVSPRRDCVC